MRGWLLALIFGLGCQAMGQASPPPNFPDISGGVHPDVVVYVNHHWTGADIVEIFAVDPKYPGQLLESQVNDLCKRLDSPPRGLQVVTSSVGSGPNLQFTTASFATVGLTDDQNWANLEPLVQAFAGAPAPFTVKGMDVFYDDFDPPLKGPKVFTSDAVSIVGKTEPGSTETEYNVKLLTQNPGEIKVENHPAAVERKTATAPTRRDNAAVVWGLILIAGVAAGALVYFLVIKRLSSSPPSSVLRKP